MIFASQSVLNMNASDYLAKFECLSREKVSQQSSDTISQWSQTDFFYHPLISRQLKVVVSVKLSSIFFQDLITYISTQNYDQTVITLIKKIHAFKEKLKLRKRKMKHWKSTYFSVDDLFIKKLTIMILMLCRLSENIKENLWQNSIDVFQHKMLKGVIDYVFHLVLLVICMRV